MSKTNYHTHHYLCGHASGDSFDYIKEAIKNGFSEIGMSDHGPLPIIPPTGRMNHYEFRNIYLKEIDKAIELYGDRIRILKSLEIEFVSGHEEYYKNLLEELDYLVLGTHYFDYNEGNDIYSAFNITEKDELVKYTNLIVEALNTKCFKILAHPDLFLLGYKEMDSLALECSKKIINAAIENNVAIEFNANGIRKGKRLNSDGTYDYSYPNKLFWDVAKEMNPKVIIGSDCHNPEELNDYAFKEAERLAKEYNLKLIEKIDEI